MTEKESDLSVHFQLGRQTAAQATAEANALLRETMAERDRRLRAGIGSLSIYFSHAVQPVMPEAITPSASSYVNFSGTPEDIALPAPDEGPEHAFFSHA